MHQDNLAVPFTMTVLGVEVTVDGIDLMPDGETALLALELRDAVLSHGQESGCRP